jgi:uncharacterized protein
MNSSSPESPDASRPILEVHGTRASSVIVHRVSADKVTRFLELEDGITEAATRFAGYQGTEIYPPAAPRQLEWVVILHFDGPAALKGWHDSPVRAEWIERFHREIGEFQLKKLPDGFGPWFAGLADDGGSPPHWKMFLTVLFGLYPTVMLLTMFLSPHTQRFGTAVAFLIGNAVSVSFLEWLGMPVVRRLLGPWLRAHGKEGRALSLAGLVLILAALGVMAFVFHLATRPS